MKITMESFDNPAKWHGRTVEFHIPNGAIRSLRRDLYAAAFVAGNPRPVNPTDEILSAYFELAYRVADKLITESEKAVLADVRNMHNNGVHKESITQ